VVIEGDLKRGLIVVCDHARNTIPSSYRMLGLPPEELHRHIAYDIGVEAVTRGLCAALAVPGVLAGFSRLLIDPNRGEEDPTLIMRLSDGAVVPGNADLDATERERRIGLFYRPYHAAIQGLVEAALAAGVRPAMLSIHSFTPVWRGLPRPWHAGILWNRDRRFAQLLIDALRREPSLVIGDNEPYAGGLDGDTLDRHATRRGLANALIEIRQDLIGQAAGVEEWVARIAALLPGVIAALAQAGEVQEANL
jgi:predicted N-formylglutamate amidohydrolase